MRNACGHEKHPVCNARDPLIEPAGVVAKGARHCVIRYDALPHFVADQTEGVRARLFQDCGKVVDRGVDIALVMHQIAKPDREAIYKCSARHGLLIGQKLRQVDGCFHKSPALSPIGSVPSDTISHFRVENFSCGDKREWASLRFRHFLRNAAFA